MKNDNAMNICRFSGLIFAGLLALATAAQAAEPFQAGVAVVDITPPLGYRMAGYYNERRNTGTHDPLFAKAVVFQQGDVRAALVVCDLVSIPAEISSAARNLAQKTTGIPARHIA